MGFSCCITLNRVFMPIYPTPSMLYVRVSIGTIMSLRLLIKIDRGIFILSLSGLGLFYLSEKLLLIRFSGKLA